MFLIKGSYFYNNYSSVSSVVTIIYIFGNNLDNANEKDKSPSPTVKVFKFSLKYGLSTKFLI